MAVPSSFIIGLSNYKTYKQRNQKYNITPLLTLNNNKEAFLQYKLPCLRRMIIQTSGNKHIFMTKSINEGK